MLVGGDAGANAGCMAGHSTDQLTVPGGAVHGLDAAQRVLGQCGLDVREGAALEAAKAAFAQTGFGGQWRARGMGNGLGGSVGALQVAGVDGRDGFLRQRPCDLAGLP